MSSRSRHFHRGNKLYKRGDLLGAAAAYRQHVNGNPQDKNGYYNLAVTLEAVQQPEAALLAYSKALELDAWYPEALNNLAILLHTRGHFDVARECYSRALASRSDYQDAEYNLATLESSAGNYPAAAHHFSKVLERNPRRADAWNNLGNMLLHIRQPAEAREAFRLALALQPDLPDAAWNATVAQLTLGQLPDAWKGFESRTIPRHTTLPRWTGEPLTGKRLLVHAEQGLGDTIQFLRYCSQVNCDHIILECHPPLIPLFDSFPGIQELRPFGGCIDNIDFQIPLMSLPELFQTQLDTIPSELPYLHPDPLLVQVWKKRLEAPVHSLKVGLVWSGNPNHKNDRQRSIDPRLLRSLSQVEQTTFYCLQQKPLSIAAADLHPLQFAGIFDELTFPDTAAILANLDLVISVDTAVAHLAGALARPVWTLLPFAPDWRWMLERTDTPWYRSMRLFRQPKLNDWASVIAEVAVRLQELAHQIV